MVYLLIPSKFRDRIVGFEFTLSNVSGALNKVISIISKYNLNIYHIETCFKSDDEYGLFIAIDFTNKNVTSEKLLEEFRGEKNYIKNVTMSLRFKNIIYPSRLYKLDLGGIRAVLIAEANMRGIIEGIKEELGDELGITFLYRMGYEIGRKAYRLYAQKLGIKDFEEGIEIIRALARGAGWGELKEVVKTDDKIMVRAEELWECEVQKGKTEKPASHLIRGLFAGFFKESLGKDLRVKETKCIALGDSYCEFEIAFK